MYHVYSKPELENLSQGERISFVRQFRYMTQNELSEKLGLKGESKRRSMARYERGDRNPKEDRLLEISKILNVNVNSLKKYNFTSNEDIIYILLWLEELYPRMNIDFGFSQYEKTELDIIFQNFINEWNVIREKRKNYEISYDEYVEWKLQYKIKKGAKDEENN